VLAVRAGSEATRAVGDLEGHVTALPGREARHDAAVVREVGERLPDANPIGLVVLVLQTELPFEQGIRDLVLAGHHGDPAAANVRELQVRVLEPRSEEHTSELQSREKLVCRLLLEKKKQMR